MIRWGRESLSQSAAHPYGRQTMNRKLISLISLIWMVFVMLPVSAAYSQPKPRKMPVGAEAMRILKSMSDFLGGLKRFSFKVVNMREEIRSGHRVDFEVAAQVTIERPNKLKAVREGHLLDQEIYYNGTSLSYTVPPGRSMRRLMLPSRSTPR